MGRAARRERAQATVMVAGSDEETAAADLSFTITELTAHGTLPYNGTTLAQGDSLTDSPADLVYEPNSNYNGADSFKYELSDRGDPDNCSAPSASCDTPLSDQKTVSITVTPVNDAPTAAASDGNPGS